MKLSSLERRVAESERRVLRSLDARIDRQYEKLVIMRNKARLHATAVAAIVLAGEARIGEPLTNAWERTLTHYEVEPTSTYGEIAKALYPIIIEGVADEGTRFAEIFAAAPPWLLAYTLTEFDAGFLNFRLPDLSAARLFCRKGLLSATWPALPLAPVCEDGHVPEENFDPSLSLEDGVFILEMLATPERDWTRLKRHRFLEIASRLNCAVES